ncbi:uncharacterized protein LOC132730107 [Ruditapes philippinarum]|uniref:uncharacterized protein LOC132730107 n=1 Tax=Ruditapes philippinarum TaxID=129788 RepID=UPI00295BE6AB|nr:uncharacterized protein LOC132730107 [Ruditapes philippinarum]
MILTLIFVLQTTGTLFGAQILSDPNLKTRLSGKNRNGIRFRERSRLNEENKSDQGKTDENVPEKWLVDAIYYDDYQSDAPAAPNMASEDVCPPVPDVVSDDACAHNSCQKDTDCSDGYRCCFTGCSFTCLREVQPAALVDWRKEPRRSRSGISWLINKPITDESSNEVETCSTSPIESDEDPLLCPQGYFCHVTDPGNLKDGIPNSGYCVKHNAEKYSQEEVNFVITSSLKKRQTCAVDDVILLHGAKIQLKDKFCRCKNGYLSCRERGITTKIKKNSKNNKSNKRNRKDKRQRKGKNKTHSRET